MNFSDYQKSAMQFAAYPRVGKNFVYPAVGLAGETGEILNKVQKILRDQNETLSDETRAFIAKEMGDVLWYLATLAHEIGYDLDAIAQGNIEKLTARKEMGTIHDNGKRAEGG